MRLITLAVSLITAVIIIALLARILPPEAAAILLDINRGTWPLTVQNILWLAFFVGLGELSIRWRAGRLEESQISRNYLPEDDETVLRPGEDLTPIYQKVRASKYRKTCFVPRGPDQLAAQLQPGAVPARDRPALQHHPLHHLADPIARVHRHRHRHHDGAQLRR